MMKNFNIKMKVMQPLDILMTATFYFHPLLFIRKGEQQNLSFIVFSISCALNL